MPAVGPIETRAAQWQKRGAPVEVLDRDATAEHVGHGQYVGAWLDRRGGVVQPLAYARGLAKAALAAGAAIHGETRRPASSTRTASGSSAPRGAPQ